MTNYRLRHAKNGWVFECKDEESRKWEAIVGTESDGSDEEDTEAFSNFLWAIMDSHGPTAGKYSAARIRIVTLPGNSWRGELSDKMRKNLTQLRDDCNNWLDDKEEV